MPLKCRQLTLEDVDHLRELHEKYYSQFDFPDFFKECIANFGIIDEESNEIVIAGGVRPIAESLLVTDQKFNRIKIGRALVLAQRISEYICQNSGLDELHAFVTNEDYKNHLIQHGFSPRSPALSMKVPHGQR